MNDLFSANSFRRLAAANANSEEMITIDLGGRPPLPPKKTKRGSAAADIQMASAAEAARDTVNLDKFFSDVEGVKEELSAVEATRRSLEQLHDESKLAHSSRSVKDLRSRMDAEVSDVLKRAKVIKLKLEALDRANAANRSLPGCGPGSSTDRTRSSVVSGLRRKLKDSMEEFQGLRQRIMGEYKETIGRRYFTVTGQQAEESTLEKLISTGESEQLLQRAIRDQAGRGNITDTVSEIQERHDGVKEMEKSLLELHQIFLDMSVLVESQGAMLDDIEANVGRASSFVRDGAGNLEMAKVHQKSTRKWTCIAIVLVLVIVLIIVIPIVVSLRKTTTTS